MNEIEQSKLELTADEWQRADALARELAKDTDRNEFGKIVTYMRRVRDPQRVIKLLDRLPNANYSHSRRTKDYFARIRQAYVRHLKQLPKERAVLVASWAFRLTTYYNTIRPQQNRRRW
jgi:hypothetical protein